MKLEDQVVSLELAKKLKELGVKQESWFYHCYRQITHMWSIEAHDPAMASVYYDSFCSAFTVAELGEMLPEWVTSHKLSEPIGLDIVFDWVCRDYIASEGFRMDRMFRQHTEANARAKMLIHLIKKGIIKVEDKQS